MRWVFLDAGYTINLDAYARIEFAINAITGSTMAFCHDHQGHKLEIKGSRARLLLEAVNQAALEHWRAPAELATA